MGNVLGVIVFMLATVATCWFIYTRIAKRPFLPWKK